MLKQGFRITALCTVILLSGCGLFGDRVADDLEVFINEQLMPAEDEINATWDEYIVEVESLTDDEFYDYYQTEVKPFLDEKHDYLQGLEPDTEEVQELQRLYMEEFNVFIEASSLEAEGVYQQDEEMLLDADQLFLDYHDMTGFHDELDRLVEEHNVEYLD